MARRSSNHPSPEYCQHHKSRFTWDFSNCSSSSFSCFALVEAHFKHQVLLIFVSFEIEPGCVGKVVEKAAGLKKFLRQIPVFQLLLFFLLVGGGLADFLFCIFFIIVMERKSGLEILTTGIQNPSRFDIFQKKLFSHHHHSHDNHPPHHHHH